MDLEAVIESIRAKRATIPQAQGLLVAISGIDASGKTTIANRIVARLQGGGLTPALIHLDEWHSPPSVRFSSVQPAEHFYHHAFRFNELFASVIAPLQRTKAVQATVQLTRLPENDFFEARYDLDAIDVIVLEGIFLLKQELRPQYDVSCWVDCAFETALERAVHRNQEGLAATEIVHDYQTIYFPAQRIHLERDQPRLHADVVIANNGLP